MVINVDLRAFCPVSTWRFLSNSLPMISVRMSCSVTQLGIPYNTEYWVHQAAVGRRLHSPSSDSFILTRWQNFHATASNQFLFSFLHTSYMMETYQKPVLFKIRNFYYWITSDYYIIKYKEIQCMVLWDEWLMSLYHFLLQLSQLSVHHRHFT